jgi:prepilin-type processing-associated H-X9-DG protein
VRYGSIRRVGGEGRDFSYSFHAQTMDVHDMRAAYIPNAAPRGAILPGIRLGSVRSAASKIYIAEEIGPNDTFWLNPLTDTWHGISQNDDDTPSGRHAGQKFLNALRNTNTSSREYKAWKTAGKGNQCFFDGHVEPLSPGDILDDKRQDNYYMPLFGQ